MKLRRVKGPIGTVVFAIGAIASANFLRGFVEGLTDEQRPSSVKRFFA
jgi:hypothetical protein